MSFKIIVAGIMEIFISVIMIALVLLNMIPSVYFIYSFLIVGVVFGLITALIGMAANGVIGPFMSAKTGNKNLIAILTASGRILLRAGNEKAGMTKTKEGYFLTPSRTVYTWPNGARGGFAFFKYGTTLEPKFVKATSKLKEKGIHDIEELDYVDGKFKEQGKELVIDLE